MTKEDKEKIDKLITGMMMEFANTPLKERKDSWYWLKKAKEEINKL